MVCDAKHARMVMQKVVKKWMLTVRDFEAGHWVMLEQREGFNKVLGEWLESGGTEGKERAKL